MTRLTHSSTGFLRYMQMSPNTLFIFIEGGTDRYFYDLILKGTCLSKNVKYEIITSCEIQSNDGGKETLINFFNYLKENNKLIDSFKEKISVGFFILDKDLDDIQKKKKRSHHILYTKHYCLENYFYIHGNLSQSSAVSASFPIELFEPHLSDADSWRYKAATNWKEWIKLCIFSSLYCSQGSQCTYKCISRINSSAYSPIIESEYESCKNSLLQRSRMDEHQFTLEYQKVSDMVDKIFETRKIDGIFSGKWYKNFLVDSIVEIVYPQRIIHQNCIQARLETSLKLTLNFDDKWTDYFKRPIENILVRARIITS